MGHKVDVYEEREALGGMLRYGIPNYRLPKDRLDEDINAILSTGNITVHYNTAIGRDITMEQLKEQYNAIYIAIGAQVGKSVNVDGVNSNGVYSAVEMLGEIGRGNIPDYTGKSVVVVGGGNVAMDAARTALRLGAEVHIVYRRREAELPVKQLFPFCHPVACKRGDGDLPQTSDRHDSTAFRDPGSH